MNLDEVQAAGRFAWHPDGNLIYVSGEGVLWLLVDEGGLIYDILKPKRALPAWALAGWRHERTCPCDLCAKDYPIAAATAEPVTPGDGGRSGVSEGCATSGTPPELTVTGEGAS